MGDEHARYEELAVGHVLGGLPTVDADDFRGHLIDCRECRLRVAELRDIAADLAAAERDERQRARTKTRVVRTTADEAEPDGPADRSWPWQPPVPRTLAVVTIVLLAAVMLLGLWTLHLRTVNAELLATTARQEAVMEAFADGATVATTFGGSTSGRVAVTSQGLVALTLVGVPQPPADRRLVIWLVAGSEARPVFVGTRAGSDGRVAWSGEREGADRLLVTLERWPPEGPAAEPGGTVIAEADLAAPQVEHVPDGTEPRSTSPAH